MHDRGGRDAAKLGRERVGIRDVGLPGHGSVAELREQVTADEPAGPGDEDRPAHRCSAIVASSRSRNCSRENSWARAARAAGSHDRSATAQDRLADGRGVGVVHEQPVLARPDDVHRPAACECDDRRAGGERLDHRDPEVLLADVDEPGGAFILLHEVLAGHPAVQLDVRWEGRAQLVLERPDADHHEPVRQVAERLDHRLRVLVGDQPVGPEEEAGFLLGGGVEVLDVHRRMDDDRVPAVRVVDPLAYRLGDGDVHVRPPRRIEVLPPQPAAGEAQAERGRAAHPLRLRLGQPGVADRRVAVAEVERVPARAHLDCARVRRGDDDVVGVQVEVPEVRRHVREEQAPAARVVALAAGFPGGSRAATPAGSRRRARAAAARGRPGT